MSLVKNKSITKVITLCIVGFFIFVCQDSTAKYLGALMPLNQVVWGRFFFHFVIILVLFAILKPKVSLKKNFSINTRAPFLLMQESIKIMIRDKNNGTIASVLSMAMYSGCLLYTSPSPRD